MTIDCCGDVEVVICGLAKRNSDKAAPSEKSKQLLTRSRVRPLRADVDFLTRTINHHGKLHHLTRAQQTIEMRGTGVVVEIGFVGSATGTFVMVQFPSDTELSLLMP